MIESTPHVLTIMVGEDGDRDWTVEHPDCPLCCPWFPPVDGRPWFEQYELDGATSPEREGTYRCLVQWEIDCDGIDSLDVGAVQLRGEDGEIRLVGEHLDAHYVPATKWEAEWRRLRPGRYLIEGWYTPGGWAGDYYDADCGLRILERLP